MVCLLLHIPFENEKIISQIVGSVELCAQNVDRVKKVTIFALQDKRDFL